MFAAGGSAVVLMTQGCIATQDWVKGQMQPVSAQVSTYDERLTYAERQISSLGGRLNGVEGTLGALDAKTEKALNAIANLKVERRVVIDVKDGATFGFGSSQLPKKSRKEIDAVLNELKAQPGGLDGTSIVVAGHTDNAGDTYYNYELGQQRANTVARYVTTKTATEPVQVIPVSYGKSAPLSANNTAQGRAKNRRVEILVYREVITSSPATPAAADGQPSEPRQSPARLSQNK
jgi:outer membrane protein OmpA-like peptidoglycan-associated protein